MLEVITLTNLILTVVLVVMHVRARKVAKGGRAGFEIPRGADKTAAPEPPAPAAVAPAQNGLTDAQIAAIVAQAVEASKPEPEPAPAPAVQDGDLQKLLSAALKAQNGGA